MINDRQTKVLLAVDESQGAMRAVDYAGTMLKSSASEMTLCHVVRGLYPSEKESEKVLDLELERKWLHWPRTRRFGW